jgi:hypothetical protein
MPVIRIEHPVLDYDRWKAAFDSDPQGREQAGVRRYRVMRANDDPSLVAIDLEFDSDDEAQVMLAALRAMWSNVDGVLIKGPRGQVFDVVETIDL